MENTNKGKMLRNALLETVKELSESDPNNLQSGAILGMLERRLKLRERDDPGEQQALLTFWHDLFRTGYLSWGIDIDNPDPPFCHLTARGHKWLQHYSRDPANPDGYFAYVNKQAKLSPIAKSYLEEALKTYNHDCMKASAVMVGTAAESLALELRDVLAAKLNDLGQDIPSGLQDWRVKRVLDIIEKQIATQKPKMPRKLADMFESYWSSFSSQIRLTRNEASHPKSIDAVTPEAIQASLLIFPEWAKLCGDLRSWIATSYS